MKEEDFQSHLFNFSLCEEIEETPIIENLKKIEEELLRRYLQKERSNG